MVKNWNDNIKPSSLGYGYTVGTTDADGDFDGAMDADIKSVGGKDKN